MLLPDSLLLRVENFPSLVGIERARLEDHNWAVATFSWAYGELRRLQKLAARRLDDSSLRDASADTEAAILEQLENWGPSNGPH